MKRFLLILVAALLFICSFSGCSNNKKYDFPFVDIRWTRDGDGDTEYIRFSSNGEFSYYCACGNPVNDSDLCVGYTFDPKTDLITLKYASPSASAITKIKVIKCTENELVLEFGEEIRTFFLEINDEFHDEITHDGKKYILINFPTDVFIYSAEVGTEYSDSEIFKISHEKWDVIYWCGEIFTIEDHLEGIESYLSDKSNYTWSVTVESSESDEIIKSQIEISDDELLFFEQISGVTMTESVLFDEIEVFGTLIKTSNDGLVSATTDLVRHKGKWYWRSCTINDRVEGWPEFIAPLPESLNNKIDAYYK